MGVADRSVARLVYIPKCFTSLTCSNTFLNSIPLAMQFAYDVWAMRYACSDYILGENWTSGVLVHPVKSWIRSLAKMLKIWRWRECSVIVWRTGRRMHPLLTQLTLYWRGNPVKLATLDVRRKRIIAELMMVMIVRWSWSPSITRISPYNSRDRAIKCSDHNNRSYSPSLTVLPYVPIKRGSKIVISTGDDAAEIETCLFGRPMLKFVNSNNTR